MPVLGGCVLAGIKNGFVSVPIPPYCSLAPPLPIILDTLEFCIIFFFKMIVCFFFVVVFTSVVEKKCKKV